MFRNSILTFLLVLVAPFFLVECQGAGSKGADSADSIVRSLEDNTVIMEFDGGKVTAKDVNEMVEPQLKRFSEEALEAYQQGARRVLIQKLVEAEAEKQGKSPQALFEAMMGSMDVPDEEVQAFIKERGLEKGIKNPRTGKIEKVSNDEIKAFLVDQKRQEVQQKFVGDLLAKANSKMLLDSPRVKVAVGAKSPFLGGKDAKVVIHEFSDFECPFCKRGMEVVGQIKANYGDKVKVYFRHYPLPNHPNAKPAALASICAHEEGKFWETHDELFNNQRELSPEKIKNIALAAGVDEKKFDDCLKNAATAQILEADLNEAQNVGVNSTPTFFINGKRVAGALPFAEFKALIDAELKKN